MKYDPKIELAKGVDGLSRRRSGVRVSGMVVALVLVVAAMVLLARQGASPPPPQETARVEQPTPEEGGDALFRGMRFLKQVKRVKAPGIFLKTLDGQNHTLEQFAGKVVLVNFWATWCLPCVREMPSMERLYRSYKGRGLEILAISLDQGNEQEVRDFVKKLELTFPIVLDPGHEAKALYKVLGLPTTYLIDRRGRVVGYGMGPREWDAEAAYALVGHLLDEKG